MQPDHNGPVNPLPPLIVALFLVILGVELVLQMGTRGLVGGPEAVGWRLELAQRFAFSDVIFEWMRDNSQWPGEHLVRFVAYPFVHSGFVHALFAGVLIVTLGKMVAEVYHPVAVLVIFFSSTFAGALAYGLFMNTQIPLLGAFPAAYGLIGAYTYLLWLRLGLMGERQVRAFAMIGFLMGIQLLFGLLFGGQPDWVADLGGFVAGFGLSVFVGPGGLRRLRDRLRQR